MKINNRSIVFVFPRFKYPSGDFSLGIAYLAGYIREKIRDLEISVLDTTFHPSLDYVREFLKEKKPSIVLIYSDTLMFEDAKKIASIAKKQGSFVILGGPHPTVLPDSCFKSDYIDSICLGEGEIPLYELLKKFLNNEEVKDINGFWFRGKKGIIKNGPGKLIEDLNKMPFPAVDLFDVERYIKNFVQLDSYNQNLRGISLIISRGCPFNCSYCQPTLKKIFGNRVRLRSPSNVISELRLLKEKYNISSFYFQDDTFTAFKGWVNEFCDLIKKEKLNLLWACNTRADTADFGILKKMKEAGCVKVKLGIESINDRIRNGVYHKNISKEQIIGLIKNCKALNMQVTGFFMLGAPTETEREVWQTIKFAVNSDLDEANFSITTPLPETALYEYVKKHGWSVPYDFSCFDYYQVKRPRMSRNEISIERLKIYKKIANLYFYLHPKRFINTTRQVIGFNGLRKLMTKVRRL